MGRGRTRDGPSPGGDPAAVSPGCPPRSRWRDARARAGPRKPLVGTVVSPGERSRRRDVYGSGMRPPGTSGGRTSPSGRETRRGPLPAITWSPSSRPRDMSFLTIGETGRTRRCPVATVKTCEQHCGQPVSQGASRLPRASSAPPSRRRTLVSSPCAHPRPHACRPARAGAGLHRRRGHDAGHSHTKVPRTTPQGGHPFRDDRPAVRSSDSLTGCTDRSRSPPAERPGRSRCRTASSRCRRSRRPSTSRPWLPRSARPGCCGSGRGPYRPG